jgi:hypothetical protein
MWHDSEVAAIAYAIQTFLAAASPSRSSNSPLAMRSARCMPPASMEEVPNAGARHDPQGWLRLLHAGTWFR